MECREKVRTRRCVTSKRDSDMPPRDEWPCALCGGADDEGLVLLCEDCNRPIHAHCVGFEGPVLGDWLCHLCEAPPVSQVDQNCQEAA